MLLVLEVTSSTGAGSLCLVKLPAPLLVQPVAVTVTFIERKLKVMLLLIVLLLLQLVLHKNLGGGEVSPATAVEALGGRGEGCEAFLILFSPDDMLCVHEDKLDQE